MNITEMSREQFEKLPHRQWNEEIICDSIVIIPAKINFWELLKYNFVLTACKIFALNVPEKYKIIDGLHDSGYRRMDFAAIKNGEPICLLSGCSDVLHLDGIGGFGYNWLDEYGYIPDFIRPSGWCIDCLPRSGLLNLWAWNKNILVSYSVSSLEIYATSKEKS